jgi:hypothetical protein
MFATDRDLLAFEPNLFRDVMWVSQRLVDGQGTISGSVLTMSSADAGFDAAGVEEGHVVFINGAAYEVLERLSSTQVRLSRPRASADGAQIPVANIASAAAARVATFAPQIATVHAQVVRMLGIEPGQASTPGHPAETDVTNPAAFTRVECLGALHLIYAAAGSLTSPDSPTNQRSEFYRMRFAQERTRVTAEIDLDGDGRPDAVRKLNVVQMVRE